MHSVYVYMPEILETENNLGKLGTYKLYKVK